MFNFASAIVASAMLGLAMAEGDSAVANHLNQLQDRQGDQADNYYTHGYYASPHYFTPGYGAYHDNNKTVEEPNKTEDNWFYRLGHRGCYRYGRYSAAHGWYDQQVNESLDNTEDNWLYRVGPQGCYRYARWSGHRGWYGGRRRN